MTQGRLRWSGEQRGVAMGMASAMFVTATVLILAAIFGGAWIGAGPSVEFRLELLATSLLAPAITLLFCIVRLARHRFFTAEDINGSGLTDGSAHARLLQALLQNTLEQSVLASLVYFVCIFLFPHQILGLVPAAAAMFVVGRAAFYVGYAGGAPSRAFGFGLTMYPTVLLTLTAAYVLLARIGA